MPPQESKIAHISIFIFHVEDRPGLFKSQFSCSNGCVGLRHSGAPSERPVRRAGALSVTGVAAAVVAATALILVAAQPVRPFPSPGLRCGWAACCGGGCRRFTSRGPALSPAISPMHHPC